MADVLEEYSDCVATLHEAALAPERWPEALQAAMRLFGASGILLTDIDIERRAPRSIQTGGHEPDLLAAYAGHYESIDPTISVGMSGAQGIVYHLREHFSERQMSRLEYFQDFLFAFGVADVMATPLDYAPNARLFLSLQRRTGERFFDSSCHPLLGRFARQLNIAKQTEAKLRTAATSNEQLLAGFDALAAALFIVDQKMRVRHHNRAAGVVLRERKGVELRSGALRLSVVATDARLSQAVRAAAKPQGQASVCSMNLAGATILQLIVTPLHPAHDLTATWQEPLVLVIVSDTYQMAVAATARLRKLYGLTAAEARLVADLADGKTLREIAELRGVSTATLRTQLLSAFTKTGVHRQVELVRLVAALAPAADPG